MHRRSQGPECGRSSGSGADAAPCSKGGKLCVLWYSAIAGVYRGLGMDPLREARKAAQWVEVLALQA